MQHGSRRMGRTAMILGALVAPAPFAVDMFLPALPHISESLGASVQVTQITLTAYFLAFGLAHLIYGPWSDAKGRLPALRFGVLLFMTGSAICALAQSIEMLIGGRVVQAVGAAALTVLPRAMIRDSHTGLEATRLTALLMLILSISPLFAPLAGSIVMLFGEWRLIFVVLSVGAVLSYVLLRFAVAETLPPIERYPMSPRALYVGTRRLIRDPTFLGMTCLASFGLANFFVFVAMAPYVYHAEFGLTHLQVSLALAVNGLGFFFAAQAAAPMAERLGTDRAMMMGACGFAAMVTVMAVIAGTVGLGLLPLVAFLAAANTCLGLTIPTALCRALDPHGPIAGMAASISGAIQMGITGLLVGLTSLVLPVSTQGLVVALSVCAGLVLLSASMVLRPRRGKRGWVDGFGL